MATPTRRKAIPRSREITGVQELEEPSARALRTLCEISVDIAKAESAAIILVGSGSQRIVVATGLSVPSSDEGLWHMHESSSREPLVIADVEADQTYRETKYSVGNSEFRFYAGVPLELEPEMRTGTLCVMGRKPQRLRKEVLSILQKVATVASGILAGDSSPSVLLSGRSTAISRISPKGNGPEFVTAVRRPQGAAPLRSSSTREVMGEIRRAIGNGEFVPFYQPVVELKWGRIVGFEVLARWHHPTRGLLAPEAFRPALAQRSLAPLLTQAILNAALKDWTSWRSKGLSPGRLAVNVSSADLTRRSFAPGLIKRLDAYSFTPGDLVIEVTEGIAMGGPEGQIHGTLATLRDRGVHVTLDDFGTGFAGLQHLRNWPIDGLKLDRGFVRHCLENKEDQIIIRSIVHMSRDLGLEVVAEGIEDNAQFIFLSSIGCDLGQGFYFGKPKSAIGVPKLLRSSSNPQSARATKIS